MLNTTPKMLLLAAVLLALPCSAVHATWYNENIEDGVDIIMMDLRWPWWPPGTYYANWNTGFNPKPNNLSFYAGIQAWMPEAAGSPNADPALQRAHRPGNTWSLWGHTKDGVPPRFIDVGPTLSPVNAYGGEGTSAFLAAIPWPFVKNDRWYTMLSRVWRPPGGGDHAYCGRWIKDHADGRWHLVGVAWLPIPASSFHGNCGFIEPLGSPQAVRSLHRRLGYMRKDGAWKKTNTITITKTVYVVVNVLPEGEHEYAAIEYAQRPDLMPLRLKGPILDGDKTYDFTVRQPELPVLDKPVVENMKAVSTGSQVGVSWELGDTSSPALGYRIEVFDNPQCAGVPVAVKEDRLPSTRHALLDVAVPAPTVRLTITDIFDQLAAPVVIRAEAAGAAAAPQAAASTVPGLAYELYHKDVKRKGNFWHDPQSDPDEEHHWLTLSEFGDGHLVRRGHARGFDRSVLETRKTGYAVRYEGLLLAPADGLYILRARIDGDYPRLCLTTAGDHWMTFLGRGDSPTITKEKKMSRVIFSREGMVECLQVAHERADTGLYNAINDMAMVLLRGEMRFATTHGLQSEYLGNNMALYGALKNLEWLRPMTAMGAAALGPGNPRGRSLAQVLDPVVPGRYSRSHAWAFEWDWLTPRGDVPQGGLLAVCGDEKQGQRWWFVHTDGLYFSADGGAALSKVLDASGKPVRE